MLPALFDKEIKNNP